MRGGEVGDLDVVPESLRAGPHVEQGQDGPEGLEEPAAMAARIAEARLGRRAKLDEHDLPPAERLIHGPDVAERLQRGGDAEVVEVAAVGDVKVRAATVAARDRRHVRKRRREPGRGDDVERVVRIDRGEHTAPAVGKIDRADEEALAGLDDGRVEHGDGPPAGLDAGGPVSHRRRRPTSHLQPARPRPLEAPRPVDRVRIDGKRQQRPQQIRIGEAPARLVEARGLRRLEDSIEDARVGRKSDGRVAIHEVHRSHAASGDRADQEHGRRERRALPLDLHEGARRPRGGLDAAAVGGDHRHDRRVLLLPGGDQRS